MLTPALVPPWLDRLGAVGWRVLATALMALVLGVIAAALSTATAATLVAGVLAMALAPTTASLRARGASRTVAAALACAAGGLVLVAAAVLLAFALIPDLLAVIAAVESGVGNIREGLVSAGAPELALRVFDQTVESARGLLGIDLASAIGTAGTLGTVAVLGAFLTFFLLQDGDKGWAWLASSVEPGRIENVGENARAGIVRVGWYLRRTALLAVVDAVVVWVVLTIAGVPLAGALAALTFIAGFVPYLGAILATTAVVLATLAAAGSAVAAVVALALLMVSVVTGRVLEHTPMGRASDVHPVLVLIALTAGAALFGLLGLIALLPLTVLALAVSRSIIVALERGPHGVAPAPRPDGVPVWLDRIAQWSWRGLALAALGWLGLEVVVRIPVVIALAVIALVAAATLAPAVTRLVHAGLGRGTAAAVATVGGGFFIAVSVGLAIAMSIGPIVEIFDVALEGADDLDLAWLGAIIEEVGSATIIDVGALVRGVGGLTAAAVLGIFLTIFFLRDGSAWWQGVVARIRPGPREHVDQAGHQAITVLSDYMVGTAIISLFGAVTSGLIMVILGLPLALPIALLTFFGSFIPYIGAAVATALAFLVAVALGTSSDVVIMAVYTIVFNIVQGNLVTPLVYGRGLRLHPAVVLMAIPVGGAVAGILGMFIVVPVVAIVAATWRLVLAAIADRPAAAPAAAPPQSS